MRQRGECEDREESHAEGGQREEGGARRKVR